MKFDMKKEINLLMFNINVNLEENSWTIWFIY